MRRYLHFIFWKSFYVFAMTSLCSCTPYRDCTPYIYSSNVATNEKTNLFTFREKNNNGYKYGYISRQGKVIIKPSFVEASRFNSGLAIVRNRKSKDDKDIYGGYLLINKFGDVLLESNKIESFRCVNQGILTIAINEFDVKDNESIIRYYNAKTSSAITGNYKNGNCFENGMASVLSTNNKYGYINQNGKFNISPTFTQAGDFSEGLSFVSTDKIDGNQKYQLIDSNGNYFNFYDNYDSVDSYSEGLARIKQNGKYGYLNRCGILSIPKIYEAASRFENGIAIVKIKNEYKIIDKYQQTLFVLNQNIIPAENINTEGDLSGFFDKLARVTINNKYGYINEKGVIVITPKFTYGGNFNEGLALVKFDDKDAYIDTNGKIIWQESR
jgi:WG containing repeat